MLRVRWPYAVTSKMGLVKRVHQCLSEWQLKPVWFQWKKKSQYHCLAIGIMTAFINLHAYHNVIDIVLDGVSFCHVWWKFQICLRYVFKMFVRTCNNLSESPGVLQELLKRTRQSSENPGICHEVQVLIAADNLWLEKHSSAICSCALPILSWVIRKHARGSGETPVF